MEALDRFQGGFWLSYAATAAGKVAVSGGFSSSVDSVVTFFRGGFVGEGNVGVSRLIEGIDADAVLHLLGRD